MTRFGCALGRVLVLQGRLVEPARLDRLAHARTLQERLKVLAETEYAAFVADAQDRDGVLKAIEGRVLAALDLLDESFAEPVARFFRRPRDFANLKVVLARGRHDPGHGFLDGGTVSVERFDEGDPPEWLARELAECEAVSAIDGEVAGMAHVDRRMLDARVADARALKDPLALQLARLEVDWANARMLVRGVPRAELLAGGLIDPGDLATAFSSGRAEGVVRRVARELGDRGIEDAWTADTPADRLEAATVRAALLLARRGRVHADSTQPVIAWMASVEAEARLIRLILIGGMDGAHPGEVVSRVGASHG